MKLITINNGTPEETVIRLSDIKIIQLKNDRIQFHLSERWMVSCDYDEEIFNEVVSSMGLYE